MPDTLPQTLPARNLDTLIDELYGPRPEYRAAIATIAEKAKATLPECNGRVDKAVALVLAGDVAFEADGSAVVGSASDPAKTYHVAAGHCDCTDMARAPHGLCKHRLSAAIARRARELTQGQPQASPAAIPTPAVLPEAAFSATLKGTIHGREVLLTARGQTPEDFERNFAHIVTMLARYPVEGTRAAAVAAVPQTAPVCKYHGEMKPSTKAPGTWFCPGKLHDGTYCPERG